MIKKLEIRNLKCIEKLEIECSRLNVFIGTNSSGKSTIQQALLFVGQNMEESAGLNGKYIHLGEFEEVRCQYGDSKEIQVKVVDDEEYHVTKILKRDSETNKLHLITKTKKDGHLPIKVTDRQFQYLSCHRIGPVALYKKNMTLEEDLGNDGEFAIAYLNEHGSDVLEQQLCQGEEDFTLLGQVNWWLNYIVGAEISTEEISGTDFVKATYQMNQVRNIRPGNIGSGVSYLISILIMCLSSPKEGIMVIENPEIHLHPAAQSKLCEFFYFITAADRQIFMETHSDHIFNGFRVGLANRKMKEDTVNIRFTYLDSQYLTQTEKVKIGKYGKVENQVKDLFDQFDIDLNRMLGL